MRNPYRFSFHPTTGKMRINDVGAGLWEEVNVGQAGRNYGWPTCEGLCSNTFAQNPIYAASAASKAVPCGRRLLPAAGSRSNIATTTSSSTTAARGCAT
ncbi:MAG: PQQ-dependent sugar dehydrogenase [Betaproteobacteria bacterium]|nr:PQQ-dependent sugar dehydrogenase [Betaproteobacteria bacterium]